MTSASQLHERTPLLVSQESAESTVSIPRNRSHSETAILLGGQASVSHTILNLMKTCMGTGCLALSFAAQQGGWPLFSVGLFAIAAWNLYATQRLCECLKFIPEDKYLASSPVTSASEDSDLGDEESPQQEEKHRLPPPQGTATLGRVAWYAFGPIGLHLLDVMMVTLLIGIIVAYVSATVSFISDTPLTLGSLIDALIVASIMGYLALVPDLGFLSQASAIGLSVLLATFLVIAGYGIVGSKDLPPSVRTTLPVWPDSIGGISRWFGVVVFGFGTVPLTYNFRESMRQPTEMVRASAVAFTLVALLYAIAGIGLLMLYPTLTGDVMHELPRTGLLPILTRLAMVFVLVVTAPLIIVPCGELIEGKLQTRQRAIVRFGVCGVCVMVAVMLPSFVQVLSFVGSACVGMVGFVLPPLLYLKLSINQGTESSGSLVKTMRVVDFSLLVWGIAATVICSAFSLKKLPEST